PQFEIDDRHRHRLEVERGMDKRDIRVTPDGAPSEVIIDPPDTDHSRAVEFRCAQRSHARSANNGLSAAKHGQNFLGRHGHVLPELAVENDNYLVIVDDSQVTARDRTSMAGCRRPPGLLFSNRWTAEYNRLHRRTAGRVSRSRS